MGKRKSVHRTRLESSQLSQAPVVMLSGTIKRIHVNQRVIRSNRRNKTNDPVITVQHKGTALRGMVAYIAGPSVVIYRPDKPLSCGARVWVETRAQVILRQTFEN